MILSHVRAHYVLVLRFVINNFVSISYVLLSQAYKILIINSVLQLRDVSPFELITLLYISCLFSPFNQSAMFTA